MDRLISISWRWIAAACVLTAAGSAAAQEFPLRPLTLVTPYPAGGAADNLARPLASALQSILGQSVVVENRPGAQGIIGTDHVTRSKPDGYTLLLASSMTFAGAALVKNLPYDPDTSFQPISGMGSTAYMFVTGTNSPYRTIADVARQSQPAPPIGYGSAIAQVVIGMFASTSGASVTPVSYRGAPQVMTDVIGGQIPLAVVDIGNGMAQVKAGRVRALAVSGKARSSLAPDVPTLAETWPSSVLESIVALVAPAGTPPAVVEALDRATRAALARPEVKAAWAMAATDVIPLPTAEIVQEIKVDAPRWRRFIQAAGIEPQ